MATLSTGRELFQDESGENYSEKTITFETEYGWINMPTVDAEGNVKDQAELEEFVAENGPVDPVTGEQLSTYETVEDAVAAAEQRTDDLGDEVDAMREQEPQGYDCGGMPMMDEFVVGIDPVSGNEIPPGSSEINVRDDIPAVLSEGEYVVPADVVRYHGLKTFMALRDEAKMGLMAMHMEGQIKSLEDEEMEYEEYDEEEPVHETEEGNEVELAEHIIEEEEMDLDSEEEDEDVYASENTYKPTVRFAVIRK